MLKKIRSALLQKRGNPYPNFEEAPMYADVPTELDDLAVLFAERFTAVEGKFIFCEDELNLIENLLLLVEREKLNQIHVWEPVLQQLLDKYEFPYYSTDKDFLDAEVGITTCEALIARHGSILITNANAAGRRLSIYPHIHVVIAKTSQLVLDIKDAVQLLQKKYDDQLPSLISTITGPSRTADIEKTLVLGAHGPKELVVLLVDG